MEIRPARREDLAAILALYADLETDGQVLDLPAAESIFARMQQYPNYTVYVAVAEGQIVGSFELLIMDNLAHVGAPSGIVEDVVVHPAWRGQGIGKQMMAFALQQCRQAGCYKLALSSNRKREAAHRFYEALGFQKHGYSFVACLERSTADEP
ncbi:MAG: GNAT family N-acetyltransferase [Chloroflexi bacterium]|nr:GNAT family N-acetyltransferase [Chloroflexota bacterium]